MSNSALTIGTGIILIAQINLTKPSPYFDFPNVFVAGYTRYWAIGEHITTDTASNYVGLKLYNGSGLIASGYNYSGIGMTPTANNGSIDSTNDVGDSRVLLSHVSNVSTASDIGFEIQFIRPQDTTSHNFILSDYAQVTASVVSCYRNTYLIANSGSALTGFRIILENTGNITGTVSVYAAP